MTPQPDRRSLYERTHKEPAKPEPRLPEWRRRALEAHRQSGWVAAKEVAA